MLNQEEYKARAKRLRATVRDTLGVQCKLSQALEMIAHIENLPNWDTLSGLAGTNTQEAITKPVIERISSDDVEQFVSICASLRHGLVVITGKTNTGKSKLLRDAFPLIASQINEKGYIFKDDQISVETIYHITSRHNLGLVAIDELRDFDGVLEKAISLVQSGLLVIVAAYSSNSQQLLEKIVPKDFVALKNTRCVELGERNLSNAGAVPGEAEKQSHLNSESSNEPRFYLLASGDSSADEKAYWELVKIGAQASEFTVVGSSPHIELLDSKHGPKVTGWQSALPTPRRENDVIVDAKLLLESGSRDQLKKF